MKLWIEARFQVHSFLGIYKIEKIETLYGKIFIFVEIFIHGQNTLKQNGDVTFSQSFQINKGAKEGFKLRSSLHVSFLFYC